MDDVSFKVRQISQYPPATTINPSDVFLMQQGGLTGPYQSATRDLIVNGGLSMSAGLLPPLPHVGMTAAFSTVPNGPRTGFNWFLDQTNTPRYMQAGVAGRWDFGEGSLNFSIAPQGLAGVQIYEPWWLRLFDLDYSGNLTVYQQVRCGRPPAQCEEVVTLGYLQARAVTSFDGRFGDVCLNAADVNAALEVVPGDSVVTRFWVDDAIKRALFDLYHLQRIVYSFNGRSGNVVLNFQDVNAALNAPGAMPTAPTPPDGDASNAIATTQFVSNAITNLQNTITTDLNAYALLFSPAFGGVPTAPTAPVGTASAQLATTAFVMNALESTVAGVVSFNTRTGNVVLTQADIINAAGWSSPALTGSPTAPTPAPGDSSTLIATTAFVQAVNAAGVSSFNSRNGAIVLTPADVTGVGGALLNSPTFTGVPAAPTAAPGTNTTQLATTAFVAAATSAATAGVASFNGRTGTVSLQANDLSAVGGALLAGPAFTGAPTAPTATAGTNTTQLATTAFVTAAISAALGGGGFLPLTGGTLTGALGMNTAWPEIDLNKQGSGFSSSIFGLAAGARRWLVMLGDNTVESGSNTGSNFQIARFTDAGAQIDVPLAINRATGVAAFSAIPTSPTPAPGDNSTNSATTAFVTAAIVAAGGVASFNTRTGAVTLITADITAAGGAPLASPTFTGTPAAPTPAAATNNTQLATTAFVKTAITAAVPASVATVQVSAAFAGKPAASAMVIVPLMMNMTINWGSSQAKCNTNPTASAVFNITTGSPGGTVVSQLTIATNGGFSFSGTTTSLGATTNLYFNAPATQDATLADIGISLFATRS